METQDQSLSHLREQFALYKHIQIYHWLADTWNWNEIAKLFSEDTEYEFETAESGESWAGGVQLQNQTIRGPDAVVTTFDGLVKAFKKVQHVIVNTNFDISGATATGTANIVFWGVPDPTKPHLHYTIAPQGALGRPLTPKWKRFGSIQRLVHKLGSMRGYFSVMGLGFRSENNAR
ncbi:uncharacterized protein Z519_00907 [Cladophialophora bantiana CBS 173.52]|uniref:SnoaL-like domain-containing protein n=1 Tax=Cladophialophora bantiana (strain ATCC 10958 / CBS 173.52 / CDC B-1940 / NIH 8579) TaxID=1442370 RepID=A0A0D2IR74_CLAB1|nr:uncharacterized protein Z519_00907 [Cladophialophora bantiana CBS 173.52]KIW99244.1 hypothetical protein Z519_00907 [Cladophialophora bantiana CBS 173.52]